MEKAYRRTFVLGDPPDYEPGPERSLAGLAAARGVSPLEVAYDEMARDGGQGLLYIPILNYATGDLDHVRDMLLHPQGLLGLADGGAHTGTICDASMPTFMLTHWTRDRSPRRAAAARVRGEEADPRHRAPLRDVGPRDPGAGRAGRLQPHRLRRACRSARPTCRRTCRRAGGACSRRPRATWPRSRRGPSRSSTARRPASCPGGWCAARAERNEPVGGGGRPVRQTAVRMEAPLTQYALRDGIHIGYQVWGGGAIRRGGRAGVQQRA